MSETKKIIDEANEAINEAENIMMETKQGTTMDSTSNAEENGVLAKIKRHKKGIIAAATLVAVGGLALLLGSKIREQRTISSIALASGDDIPELPEPSVTEPEVDTAESAMDTIDDAEITSENI